MKSKLVEALEPRLLKCLDDLTGRTIVRACYTGWRGASVGILFTDERFCLLNIDHGYERGDTIVTISGECIVEDAVSLGLVSIEDVDAENAECKRIEAVNKEANDRRMYEMLKARFEGGFYG